jgi:hypothetical protein
VRGITTNETRLKQKQTTDRSMEFLLPINLSLFRRLARLAKIFAAGSYSFHLKKQEGGSV